jgi:NAD-dependent dihydropyrimidine dehydrogenase PreA subunit
MNNKEMSLHTQRHTVHSWQTMKCLYIPRDLQYIHDKQWNVFTYRETYSTFMTNNEMSFHTERHTVHSWQSMKCLYIPTDIQYIHDKQWNVFTYQETYSTFGMKRHFIVCHECTVCVLVCKDISLFVMNVLYVCGYVKTFHCLSWMYCMSLGMKRHFIVCHECTVCLSVCKDISLFVMNVLYVSGYVIHDNNEMSLHTQRHTVHSWQTMKCLYIPRDIQYIHDKQWHVFTYRETRHFIVCHECTVCLWVCKDILLFVMNVLYVSRYVKTFHCLSWMYCMSLGM